MLNFLNLVDQVELSWFNRRIWPKTSGPFHGSVWLENKLPRSRPLEQVEWFESELTTGLKLGPKEDWAGLGLQTQWTKLAWNLLVRVGRSKLVTQLEISFVPGCNAWIWCVESRMKDTCWGSKRRVLVRGRCCQQVRHATRSSLHVEGVGIPADVLEARRVCMARRGSKYTDPSIRGWDTTFGSCLVERSSASDMWGSWRYYWLHVVARVVAEGNRASTDQ